MFRYRPKACNGVYLIHEIRGKVIFLKKLLSVVLVFCMLLSVTAFSVNAAYSDDFSDAGKKAYNKLMLLDADNDGTINTEDAAMYLKAAAGIIDDKDGSYDYDGDGVVSVADAQAVLTVVAGIETPLNQSEALMLFNDSLNEVKSTRPGFERTVTMQCPSIKVTTIDAPIPEMNVTNMEFNKYVDHLVKTMNTFPYNLALNAEMQAELKAMQAEAKEVYMPQVETRSIAKTSNSHYSYFPVTNLGWSSKLTTSDVKSISCALSGSVAVVTIEMGNYIYIGDEYPTGTKGFAARQALPYGKVFNIPSFDESDGSTINKVSFKNGKVVCHIDITTGSPIYAEYTYSYDVDVTAAPQANSTLVMKTATTTNVSEVYNINKVVS